MWRYLFKLIVVNIWRDVIFKLEMWKQTEFVEKLQTPSTSSCKNKSVKFELTSVSKAYASIEYSMLSFWSESLIKSYWFHFLPTFYFLVSTKTLCGNVVVPSVSFRFNVTTMKTMNSHIYCKLDCLYSAINYHFGCRISNMLCVVAQFTYLSSVLVHIVHGIFSGGGGGLHVFSEYSIDSFAVNFMVSSTIFVC